MMPLFNVTYEIVTPESAAHGDAEDRGFIDTGLRLRDAIAEVQKTRTNMVAGVESMEDCGRWIVITNGPEFETGATESRALHPPSGITAASYGRLCRLMGVHQHGHA